MKILVTGGLGYIGSHTVVELLRKGHKVAILDNLSNSNISRLAAINELSGKSPEFFEGNVCDAEFLDETLPGGKFHGVIHFAALKSVAESVVKPALYYRNNVAGTISLMDKCIEHGINRFVFSSSAAVYGDAQSPVVESTSLGKATNPYGESKAMCERILQDIAAANSRLSLTILRYFNVAGAHGSGLLGEDSSRCSGNLMTHIIRVARGELKELLVFGDDYHTPDGTGIRDYVHVMDIARGHVLALEKQGEKTAIYNLGTGKGTSVFQMISTFQEVNHIKVPFQVVDRRPGDTPTSIANVSKAEVELGFKAELDVAHMARDAWSYEMSK